jgi:hypothetical protein|tara:strand:+ start:361 stop:1050 length:690 start_codon:yes stop_codon:yes gene_type:complete
MTNVMIRQPGYMPNVGFFKKIQSSDIFVFLDDVQFSKGSFDNRNRIKTSIGEVWITVPLTRPVFGKNLNELLISYETDWQQDHCNKIHENYRSAPYFSSYWSDIEKILTHKYEKLIDLNLTLINYFNKVLDITTKNIKSSELSVIQTKTERLIEICSKLNATCYVAGLGGKNYLDEKLFLNSGIKLLYENFSYQTYNQLYGNFIDNLSVVDLLMNEGPRSQQIIRESEQ